MDMVLFGRRRGHRKIAVLGLRDSWRRAMLRVAKEILELKESGSCCGECDIQWRHLAPRQGSGKRCFPCAAWRKAECRTCLSASRGTLAHAVLSVLVKVGHDAFCFAPDVSVSILPSFCVFLVGEFM